MYNDEPRWSKMEYSCDIFDSTYSILNFRIEFETKDDLSAIKKIFKIGTMRYLSETDNIRIQNRTLRYEILNIAQKNGLYIMYAQSLNKGAQDNDTISCFKRIIKYIEIHSPKGTIRIKGRSSDEFSTMIVGYVTI